MKRLLYILLLWAISAGPVPAQSVAHFPVYGDAHAVGTRPHAPAPPYAMALLPMRYPMLVWPLGPPLGTDTFLSNYVDDDQNVATVTDYMGGHDHLYNDHRGTDVAIFNFRLMDRGVPIVAAAPGVVTHTIFHFGDRNTQTPYPDGGNGLGIQHEDGSRAFYWHLRTHSVMVEPGERVEAGQVLAYVGSSGWTPIPHLHFELSDARDPWQGTYHTAPSLWMDQPDYVGDAPLWVMDMDLFTLAAVGGSLNGLNDRAVKERVSHPVVLGANEATVYVWVQIQGNQGDAFDVELVQPTGQVADRAEQFVARKYRYGWYAFALDLPAQVEQGTWTLRVVSGSRTLKTKRFVVGAETHYPPRFRPVAGRSIRLEGSTGHQETLSVVADGQTVAYHLLNAPGNVHLDGETLTIDAPSPQPYRAHAFQVVATDAAAHTDTLWYHLVDPTKPFNPVEVVGTDREPSIPETHTFSLAQNHPNPARGVTTIPYQLATPTEIHLGLYDLLGRKISTLASGFKPAGPHRVTVDAAGLPGGVYTYRLETPGGVVSRVLVVVQ